MSDLQENTTLPSEATMTPREIVSELDKYIIGQADAKRAVAITLRSRWRRMQVKDPSLRKEITPKNIIMIGPTGVGKTELARRLARLVKAPFIKVEATKFTEVGYVGRDVESIIRDLLEIAFKMVREQAFKKVEASALEAAEERILNTMLPPPKQSALLRKKDESKEASATRELFRQKIHDGKFDDKDIEIDVNDSVSIDIMAPPGMEDMTSQIQNMMKSMNTGPLKRRKMRVKDARRLLMEEEASKLINEEDIRKEALDISEQNGIVFIDEFDKIVNTSQHHGQVSREGVQRDLLPLIEGSTVKTKYGMVKTDHILFVASGAFQLAKPSDLIPELQGRLPIRVELNALTAEDFERILTEPTASLTKQYIELLKTEGMNLEFTTDGIKEIANIAYQVNERMENIGARRLYTIMERLLEHISFNATEQSGETFLVDANYVKDKLSGLIQDQDLSRYIL